MADATAIVSVSISGAVALAATLSQLWQAKKTREWESQTSHEAWLRDRRESAYVEMLEVLTGASGSIEPQAEAILRINARIAAFGSDSVKTLYEAWAGLYVDLEQPLKDDDLIQLNNLRRQVEGAVAADLRGATL